MSPYFNPLDPLNTGLPRITPNSEKKVPIINDRKEYSMTDREKGLIKFFNRSSMCILNYLGRMNEYKEYTDLKESSRQFHQLVPSISKYLDGADPRLFFVDKKMEDQDKFDKDYCSSYIQVIWRIFSKYVKAVWVNKSDSLDELIDILDSLSIVDPERLDMAIVCTPSQFEDIRSKYIEGGKLDLKEILKKDYSIRPEVDSIWL